MQAASRHVQTEAAESRRADAKEAAVCAVRLFGRRLVTAECVRLNVALTWVICKCWKSLTVAKGQRGHSPPIHWMLRVVAILTTLPATHAQLRLNQPPRLEEAD